MMTNLSRKESIVLAGLAPANGGVIRQFRFRSYSS